jgi:hypothetical protein
VVVGLQLLLKDKVVGLVMDLVMEVLVELLV